VRQIAGIVVGALVAAVGAVILGEYDLRGATAVIGFPLYALAITEVSVAVGGRLRAALAGVAAAVGAGLCWALWISFNHFRREQPPVVSWVMVVVAMGVGVLWGLSGRSRPAATPGASNTSST
jgi:drug/metabolite transporter (DMT)-like permease